MEVGIFHCSGLWLTEQASNTVSLPWGNKSDRIYGISLWYFFLGGLLVFLWVTQLNAGYNDNNFFSYGHTCKECIYKQPLFIRSSSYFAAPLQTQYYCYYYYYYYYYITIIKLLLSLLLLRQECGFFRQNCRGSDLLVPFFFWTKLWFLILVLFILDFSFVFFNNDGSEFNWSMYFF